MVYGISMLGIDVRRTRGDSCSRLFCFHAKVKLTLLCKPVGAIVNAPGGILHVAGNITFTNNTASDDGGEES